jgi:E3 ubiquitin-protein ligase UBR4
LKYYLLGCCSVCARVCHKDHEVSYSRHSRFFCDCGAGAVCGVKCKALKPRSYVSGKQSREVKTRARSTKIFDKDPTLSLSDTLPAISQANLSLETRDAILGQLESLASIIFNLYRKFLPEFTSRKETAKDSESLLQSDVNDLLSSDKTIAMKTNLLEVKRYFKAGTFDVKLKATGTEGKELKTLMANNALTRRAMCSNSKGKIAIGESNSVVICDVSQLLEDSGSATGVDKGTYKTIAKSAVGFDIVSLVFNPSYESYLAVAGIKECKILTLNSKFEVIDQLEVQLSLNELGDGIYIVQIHWLPNSLVNLGTYLTIIFMYDNDY